MSRRNKALFWVAALASVGASQVQAQHSTSIGVEVEHLENPLLSHVSPGSATVLRFIPNYSFEIQGDRSRSRFSAGAVIERSSNTQLLANRNYPSLGYTWGYSWPTADIELRASLAEAATRNTQLQDVGRVTVDSRERSFVTGATWNKELTARTRLSLGLESNRVKYDTPLLENYHEEEVSSRLSWEATERTSYYVEPSYARLTRTSGSGLESTLTRWLLGMRGELGPSWAITAFAGRAQTRGIDSTTGGVGGLRLTNTGSRLSSEFEWLRDMGAIGSASGYVRTQTLRARVGYQLTQDALLSASVARSESSGLAGATGNVIGLTLHNQLGANWSSVLGVEDRRSRDLAGVSGRGWAVRAGLVYLFSGPQR